MRTRGVRLSVDHVGALNLVEVEFAGEKPIIDAWKAYLTELAVPYPTQNTNAALDKDLKHNKLLTVLIHEIAKFLKLNIAQLDIFDSNYTPHDEQRQRALTSQLLQLLTGKTSLPVTLEQNDLVGQSSPYPPPPKDDQTE